MINIKHRHTGESIVQVEDDTLAGAQLRGVDLSGADLHGAEMGIRGRAKYLVITRAMGIVMMANFILLWKGQGQLALAINAAAGILIAISDLMCSRTDLSFADLHQADLGAAQLREARLVFADISDANLEQADLREVRAKRASFCGANLVGADLRGADLFDADLTGAHLAGARLDQTKLRKCRLTGVTYDARTRWPRRFDPAAHGASLGDGYAG